MGRIAVRSVSKKYGDTTALHEINLDIDDGEFMVLLGPSGCGKSTLLRIIAGLIAPTTGQVILDGADITDQPPRDRDLAMVFQSYALYPHLSAAKNIGFPLRARRTPKPAIAAQVAKVAEMLGLSAVLERRPGELSGGQRQRVAVGRAIIRNPRGFLMDEPLSNLDALLRASTRRQIIELRQSVDSTFLYVTHDQVEAMTMATRIAVLHNGRIEQVGTPEALYDEPHTTFVASFLGAPPMNLLEATIRPAGNTLHAYAAGLDLPLDLPAGELPDHDVTVGIRPERIVLNRLVQSGPHCLGTAIVNAVENLGSEVVLHCQSGAVTLLVRVARPTVVRVGDPVDLYCSSSDIHLFDRSSGRRLEWTDPQTSDRTKPSSGVPATSTYVGAPS
ncbi:carbohydrate ABC transporter ATP-binding protein (CUT1 family) [Antricoccus suffuscus]|uniref:Carbohydrate ABC transporter ATP-binding protein (CUT1 family) n=1 Tax=Antricoccus suffuscus TaxID=1629062 RepID=A0A2T1A737_9ACTN|nr:ABC transporter ATP-binding protein [Antricoccus suffuscus]PRZ44425.1 carbohydrate ABC transporter ATP-binding protein (CUT1 family) [Antricoccus suffuscus]